MRVRGRDSGELGDGGAEGPGAGGVVGYVEQELGLGAGEEFEAAGPAGVADAGFDGWVWDVVTYFVTFCECRIWLTCILGYVIRWRRRWRGRCCAAGAGR